HRLTIQPIDSLVVDDQLLIAGNVIKNRHARGPQHHQALLLVGMQPADKDVPANAAIEEQVGDGNVGNVRLQIGAAGSADLDRQLADQPQHDGNIVRRKTPENVLLAADLAQVEPVRIDVLDTAKLTRPYAPHQLNDRRVIFQYVPHHQNQARGLGL